MGVPSNDEVAKRLYGQPVTHPQSLVQLLRQPWLIALMLLAVALRLYELTASAIWGDEGSSVLLAQFPLAGIWSHASHDVHPPLYFMLLHAWIGLFGDSILSIRMMSAVPGVITVLLGTWLAHLVASRRATVLTCLLLTLLPTAVRYSQEIRMYSLMGVWLLGATIALVYWVREPARKRYLVIYALLMAASFYTHYFSALCVLSHWLYLLLIRPQPGSAHRYIARREWWLANVAIVLLFLPWLPGLIDLVRHMEELKVGGDVGWEPPVTLRSLPSMIWQLMAQDDGEGMPLWLFVTLPSVVVTVMGFLVWTDRNHYRFDTLLVIYSALPLLLVFAISFVSPVFIERYLTVPALGLPIILALAIDRLARRFKVLAALLLVAVLAVEGAGLKNNYTVDAGDQFNNMVEYMNQHTVAGDQVVLGDMFWLLTWGYYDKSATAPRLYTPPTAKGVSTRPNSYGFGTLVDENAGVYLDHLEELPEGNGRVWLVMSRVAPDEFPSIPVNWRKIDQHAGGDTQAVLYEVCHPSCSDDSPQ
ncbi:glycosyltransferase family 39 protein [Pseudomonas gingeri]|uniref:Glycosyltransferase family 39 protein n=1 Tax=Pseudomonas gingeri TaxID=117681 RepID=A0A7Y8C041_9PSED|nr:glycosyltransferase family 39 protein [Pseudomonas gingeri]NWA29540.1 glycosyltransferase family 39 protein [Pseudomonas gingeri]NWB94443.1 glycosyltransferase family 39 protein [Pseudomonas gingeri]NWD66588.1 glycosyltransferase family 39 protein [Pseudomonas gingeri]NWD77539.1 glycosyltransferase family 39 protein [Pseudomonas gingeri]